MLQVITLALLALTPSALGIRQGNKEQPTASPTGWSAAAQSCKRDSVGRVSMALNLKGTIENTGQRTLIVPRRVRATGLQVSLTPSGPKPWHVDTAIAFHHEWSFEARPPQSPEPDPAEFLLVPPDARQPILLEIQSEVLLAEGSGSSRARIGLRAGFRWDAGHQRFPSTEETAGRWRHIGDLVYGQGVTDWIVVDIPRESECPTTGG